MKIWRLYVGDYNTGLVEIGETKADELVFKGEKVAKWKVPSFKASKKGKHRDFAYYIGGVPVFSRKTIDVVGEIIENDVQLLDIKVINLNIEYKLVNVISVIDAVDYARSIPLMLFKGRVSGFKKLSFLEEVIKDQPIFRIPEFPSTRVYVSDAFKEAIELAKLKGFDFEEVWDSEWTDELEQEQQERYQSFLSKLEQDKGEEFSWSDAIERLKRGGAVASGIWKMHYNESGELIIAKLSLDCEYVWSKSNIIPPILLALKWHVIKD